MTENPTAKQRLGPQDWILAGFRALVAGGHSALRAEALARDLGATKGSFYWHFKDLRDFHEKMLEVWEDLATTRITEAVQRAPLPARDQVLLLMEMVSVLPPDQVGGAAVEPAIRAWALAEPWVQRVQVRVDARRLSDTEALLAAAGLTGTAARRAAEALYAMVIGFENLRLTGEIAMADHLRGQAILLMDQTDESVSR